MQIKGLINPSISLSKAEKKNLHCVQGGHTGGFILEITPL